MTSASALLTAPAATVPAHAATEVVGRLRTAIEAASRRWMARSSIATCSRATSIFCRTSA